MPKEIMLNRADFAQRLCDGHVSSVYLHQNYKKKT